MASVREAVRGAQRLLATSGTAIAIDGVWGKATDGLYRSVGDQLRSAVDASVAAAGFGIVEIRARVLRQVYRLERVKSVVDAAVKAGISGTSMVNLLASIKVESNFEPGTESAKYSDPGRAKELFPALRSYTDGQIRALSSNPSRFFEAVYGLGTAKGKDLGNVNAGDGAMFPGRGYLQITGRYNYEQFARASGINVVANPNLLNDPAIAAKAAVWYWKAFVVSRGADRDIRSATRIINPANVGFAERVAAVSEFQNFA